MRRYARVPAIFAMVATAAVGMGALYAGGVFSGGGAGIGLEGLELEIAGGKATAETWQRYGDALRGVKRWGHAAEAYRRAVALDGERREARLGVAVSLMQAGDVEGCFGWVGEQLAYDAKLAVDLLERQELAGLRGDGRYEGLLRNAKAQAAD